MSSKFGTKMTSGPDLAGKVGVGWWEVSGSRLGYSFYPEKEGEKSMLRKSHLAVSSENELGYVLTIFLDILLLVSCLPKPKNTRGLLHLSFGNTG